MVFWSEGVVSSKDGLHFFEVAVTVEGWVAAEEEVGNYTDGPDITMCLDMISNNNKMLDYGKGYPYTGFPWPVFLKISGAMYPGVPHVVVKT